MRYAGTPLSRSLPLFIVIVATFALVSTSAGAAILEQEAKLLADDGEAQDLFGDSVSVDGNTVLVGAPEDDDNGEASGAAYVFTRSNGVWTQQAKLISDDNEAEDYFGGSVAVSGDTALIGAWGDDPNYDLSGSAYVFVRSGGTWTQQAKLVADDAWQADLFGHAVALEGDTALIGAYGDDDGGSWAGSAYVFTRAGGVWTQQAKLMASDAQDQSHFGYSVALDGETALIGAYGGGFIGGAAYVFTRTGGVWTEQAKIRPNDGVLWDLFGWSVALGGDTALISDPLHYRAAYFFERAGGVWTQQARIQMPPTIPEGYFGMGLAVEGDTALIGSHPAGDDPIWDSVFLFVRTDGVWTEEYEFQPTDLGDDDKLGWEISLDGDTAVLGAAGADFGLNRGAAYVVRVKPPPDVPAVGAWGTVALFLTVLGTGVWFARRRATA
jgi:hypothetical protein